MGQSNSKERPVSSFWGLSNVVTFGELMLIKNDESIKYEYDYDIDA